MSTSLSRFFSFQNWFYDPLRQYTIFDQRWPSLPYKNLKTFSSNFSPQWTTGLFFAVPLVLTRGLLYRQAYPRILGGKLQKVDNMTKSPVRTQFIVFHNDVVFLITVGSEPRPQVLEQPHVFELFASNTTCHFSSWSSVWSFDPVSLSSVEPWYHRSE